MSPIIFITGSPAVGKSTLATALLRRFPFGLHIPVDDLREWVVSGVAHPLNWSEETTRQFQLAEQAACDLAVRYSDAGFAVAIDHCQGPPTLDKLIEERLSGRVVHKIAVTTSLEKNLSRNRERTHKPFEASLLEPAIQSLSPLYRSAPIHEQGWIVFDNEADDIDTAVDALLDRMARNRGQ